MPVPHRKHHDAHRCLPRPRRLHAAAIIISFLAAAVTYSVVRRRARRPLIVSLWAASVVSIGSLTFWIDGGEALATCMVNKDVLEPFTTVQGLLNVAMLLPFGLLGVLATRRLPLMAALSILFPALIEIAQAVVPFVSRLCDTSDLVANTRVPWSVPERATPLTGSSVPRRQPRRGGTMWPA